MVNSHFAMFMNCKINGSLNHSALKYPRSLCPNCSASPHLSNRVDVETRLLMAVTVPPSSPKAPCEQMTPITISHSVLMSEAVEVISYPHSQIGLSEFLIYNVKFSQICSFKDSLCTDRLTLESHT